VWPFIVNRGSISILTTLNDSLPTARATPGSSRAIRLSLGLVYLHFGLLKFYPDLSPAEMISGYTAQRLSCYWLDSGEVLFLIAILECFIGGCFLLNVFLRWVAPLFFFHMAATFLPIFLLPELTFKVAPFAPTFEGQYILKNLVLVSAGWVVLSPYLREFHIFQKPVHSGRARLTVSTKPE
jgi:hypothetical protein